MKGVMVMLVLAVVGLLLLGAVGGVVYLNREKLGLPTMAELKQDFDQGFSQGVEKARERAAEKKKQSPSAAAGKSKRRIASSAPMHVNQASFAKASQRKDVLVLVDYYADWCGPCKRLAPDLEKLVREHGDKVVVLKVNVDSDGELAQQAGVSSIPDVRILYGGKQVDRFVGQLPYKKIEKLILKHESLLPPPGEVKAMPSSNGVGTIDPVTKRYLPPGMSRK